MAVVAVALSSYNLNLATALLLLLSVTTAVSCQQCDSTGRRIQELSKLFEEALVNSRDALWQLQQIYFNPSDHDQSPASVYLSVWVTVDDIISDWCSYDNNGACPCIDAFDMCSQDYSDNNYCNYGQWVLTSYYKLQPFQHGSSKLARLMSTSGLRAVFYAFDPTFYSIMEALYSSTDHEVHNYNTYKDIKMHINTTLHHNPCWDDATNALEIVLMWAKAYARANGIPTEKQDTDRSTVWSWFDEQYLAEDSSMIEDSSYMYIPFLCIFILSNLLLLSLTLLNLRKSFLWLQRQGKKAKPPYKASAVVLTCVNIITLISDITIIVVNSTRLDWHFNDVLLLVLPAKGPLVLLVLILELPLACSNTHILNGADQVDSRCQRFAHAFAFCQISWFMHRLVNDVIISVVFFVIAPAQTLGIDALLLTTLGSTIAFVAIIIHKWSRSDGYNKQLCSFVFCTTLNGLMICGLLFVISWAFIIFVGNGLKSAGMGGLILSLIPPVAATVIGYIVKEKYFKSTSSESENVLQEMNNTIPIQNINDAEQHPQEATPLLRSQC